MIAVVLGLPGSASTWAFNVVREFVSGGTGRAASLYADRASDLLAALSATPAEHVVVKAHALDRPMLALLRACGGHLILTTRDPRDSLLSMQDRFGHAERDVARQIALSAACAATVRDELPHLHLAYESRFPRHKSAVARIAAHLAIEADPARCEAIFDKLKVSVVRAQTNALAAQGLEGDWFDPQTHWHPNHVGNGRSEKWSGRMSSRRSEAYVGAFAALATGDYRQRGAVSWRPELFSYHDARDAEGIQALAAARAECLVSGPHFYLPAGRWRAGFGLEVREGTAPGPVQLEIISDSVHVLAMRRTTPEAVCASACTLDFEVRDHMLPLEARVHSLENERVNLHFEGVDLEWIGPAPQPEGIARPL